MQVFNTKKFDSVKNEVWKWTWHDCIGNMLAQYFQKWRELFSENYEAGNERVQ